MRGCHFTEEKSKLTNCRNFKNFFRFLILFFFYVFRTRRARFRPILGTVCPKWLFGTIILMNEKIWKSDKTAEMWERHTVISCLSSLSHNVVCVKLISAALEQRSYYLQLSASVVVLDHSKNLQNLEPISSATLILRCSEIYLLRETVLRKFGKSLFWLNYVSVWLRENNQLIRI